MLREAREREGYDVVTMARRLHIRPDILKAIENADFDRMPAAGYTKNMIRAFARQVGLNEHQIVNMYLDDLDAFEYGYPARSGRDSSAMRAESRSVARASSRSVRGQAQQGRQSSRSRSTERPVASARRGGRPGSAMRDQSARTQELSGRPRSPRGGSGIGVVRTNNGFTQPVRAGAGNIMGNVNLPLLIGIAVGAIILIIVLVMLFNGSKQSVEDVPDIPISGLTDTSDANNAAIQQTPTIVEPTSALFEFSIEAGAQSWITVTEDGQTTLNEVLTGPVTKSYNVTTTLTFSTANPDPITVTVEGEEVKLQKDPDSSYYTYTLDFPTFLTNWELEHVEELRGANAKAASATNSAAGNASAGNASQSTGNNAGTTTRTAL